MINKSNGLGKKMTKQDMKKVRGGFVIGFVPGCIALGAPCGGGGCTDPDPVCCDAKAHCTGQNGLGPIIGTCEM